MSCSKSDKCVKYKSNIGNPYDWQNPCKNCKDYEENRVFAQDLKGDRNGELKDAFETVGIIVRAKIERLANENKFEEAKELEKALMQINNADYNH